MTSTRAATPLSVTLALALALLPAPAAAGEAGRLYRIGVLRPSEHAFLGIYLGEALRASLRELGYVEGANLRLDERYAADSPERLRQLAAELVRLHPDVVVTEGIQAALAVADVDQRTPVVMVARGDPVASGLVESLDRPGGNVTGITALAPLMLRQRLELLREALPRLGRLAVLWNPADPDTLGELRETEAAARSLGIRLRPIEVRARHDLEAAVRTAVAEESDALLVLADGVMAAGAEALTSLATKSRLPAMYNHAYFVKWGMGGLMSYAPSSADLYRAAAAHVDRIVKGAAAAELPVRRPITFELAVNLRTARRLGLTIPPSVIFRADDVIE